ncbi:MAG: UDP-N-acetylmuramate dehydrogenase [Acidimicrobiales bacterium]
MNETVEAAARLLGPVARHDVPIGPLTTYRVGGSAALLVTANREDDLSGAAEAVATTGVDVLVVGKGSNLLVADGGFPGLVIVLGDTFASIAVDGAAVVAGGSSHLPVVARRTAAAGLTGFEWAVGVPGSVGGAVRMNAGGHGSDMAATLVRVRVHDLAERQDGWVPADQLDLGYRQSNIAPHQVVTAVELALEEGDRSAAEAEIAEIVRWRRDNQPGGQNAGSVFTNPPGDAAGRLIDVAGCRGLRLGTAHVSEKHANFMIAEHGGRADDVWALMAEVRRRVLDATGIGLEPETRLIGFEPPTRRTRDGSDTDLCTNRREFGESS